MKIKSAATLFLIVFLNGSMKTSNIIPDLVDLIPNEEIAKRIAEDIWYGQFGENICSGMQVKTNKENGIWLIEHTELKATKGGYMFIKIQAKDCKVLEIRVDK